MFNWTFLTIEIIYLFYFLIFFCSICIVSLNNPVQSILYLILVFIITSFLFVLYNFTFLGLILMIVYLGAVVVLFLFIVMLLNIKVLELRRSINFYPFLFLVASFIFFFFLINNFEFSSLFFNDSNFLTINNLNWSTIYFTKNSFLILSEIIYSYFFFQFLLSGMILFLAMIGAIVLTLTQSKNVKKQISYLQLIRNRSSIFFSN